MNNIEKACSFYQDYIEPITIYRQQVNREIENMVYTEVERVGVSVDKDRLLEVIKDSRSSYQQGYQHLLEELSAPCSDMKLNEAIDHLVEQLNDDYKDWSCEDCKNEHRQLLKWLLDYRRILNEK